MSIVNKLNTTVSIQTQTTSASAIGGEKILWVDKATNVKARVSDIKPWLAVQMYGKFDATNQKRVYINTNHQINIRDAIVIAGRRFRVHSVQNAGGEINRLWQIDCVFKPGEQ